MTIEAEAAVDGRRARRDRNRAAVIDALFSLLDEGETSPAAESIAGRAGVSVSSLFRYFEGLDDLQEQTIEAHFARFGSLFEVPSIGSGSLAERIGTFVDARLALYRSIAPVARLARARAVDHAAIAAKLAETRSRFADQIRSQFAPELDALSPARRQDVADLIDALTSFESWDLLHATHGRTERGIRRTWVAGISALVRP